MKVVKINSGRQKKKKLFQKMKGGFQVIKFFLLIVFFSVVSCSNGESARDIFNQGTLYFFGGEGREVDRVRACELFESSAELNYPEAQHNLAICYHFGQGRDEDVEAAEEWYERAARNGYLDSRLSLAIIKLYKSSVQYKGVVELREILNSSSCGLHCTQSAQSALGVAYLFSLGVDQDVRSSVMLLKSSAELSNPVSISLLNRLVELGYKEVEKVDMDKYLKIFEMESAGKYSIDEPYLDVQNKLGKSLATKRTN